MTTRSSLAARRLWLMFRWDLVNGLCLIAFMVAAFYAMDLAAGFCRAIGWCA